MPSAASLGNAGVAGAKRKLPWLSHGVRLGYTLSPPRRNSFLGQPIKSRQVRRGGERGKGGGGKGTRPPPERNRPRATQRVADDKPPPRLGSNQPPSLPLPPSKRPSPTREGRARSGKVAKRAPSPTLAARAARQGRLLRRAPWAGPPLLAKAHRRPARQGHKRRRQEAPIKGNAPGLGACWG